jgi:hypothetical protein
MNIDAISSKYYTTLNQLHNTTAFIKKNKQNKRKGI